MLRSGVILGIEADLPQRHRINPPHEKPANVTIGRQGDQTAEPVFEAQALGRKYERAGFTSASRRAAARLIKPTKRSGSIGAFPSTRCT